MVTDKAENIGQAQDLGREGKASVAARPDGGNGGKKGGWTRVRFFLAGIVGLVAVCSTIVFIGNRLRDKFASMINAGPGAEKPRSEEPQYQMLRHDGVGAGGTEPSRCDNEKM